MNELIWHPCTVKPRLSDEWYSIVFIDSQLEIYWDSWEEIFIKRITYLPENSQWWYSNPSTKNNK